MKLFDKSKYAENEASVYSTQRENDHDIRNSDGVAILQPLNKLEGESVYISSKLKLLRTRMKASHGAATRNISVPSEMNCDARCGFRVDEEGTRSCNTTSSSPVISDSQVTNRSIMDYDSIPAVAKNAKGLDPVPSVGPSVLQACCHCERKFGADIVLKHETICSKVKKNRSKFDTIKHRLAGLPVGALPPKKAADPLMHREQAIHHRIRRPSWRDKSDQLRAAIGAARTSDPREREKFEAELSRVNQDILTRCDYCGRSFNTDVAARHIPFCKDKANAIPRNLPNLPSKRILPKQHNDQMLPRMHAPTLHASPSMQARGRISEGKSHPTLMRSMSSSQTHVYHTERTQARSPQRFPIPQTKSYARMRF